MKALLKKIRKLLRDRRIRQLLTRTVSVIAAVVVFVTTYALVLPAITMETEALCGLDAHQHDESCYTKELVCGQEESGGHSHTEDCYIKVLVCGKEAHTHSQNCYKGGSDLTVQMEADAVADPVSPEITEPDPDQEENTEFTAEMSAGSGSVYDIDEDSLSEDSEPADAGAETAFDEDGESGSSEMDTEADDDWDLPEEDWDDTGEGVEDEGYIEVAEGEGAEAEWVTDAAEGEGAESIDDPEEAESEEYEAADDAEEGESEDAEAVEDPEEAESEEYEAADDAEEGESEDAEAVEDPEEAESEEYEAADDTEEGESEESETVDDAEEGEGEESEAVDNAEEGEIEGSEGGENTEAAENEGTEAGENTEAVGNEGTEAGENAEVVENEKSEAAEDVQEAENGGTIADVDPADYPAVTFEDRITVTAGSLNSDTESGAPLQEVTELTVHVEAEEGTFPPGTTMRLAEADPDTVAAALEGAVEGRTKGFHAVDISFWSAPGDTPFKDPSENLSEDLSEDSSENLSGDFPENLSEDSSENLSNEPVEIEPLKPIRVSITSEAIRQAVEDSSTAPVVMHIEDPAQKDPGYKAPANKDSAQEDPSDGDSAREGSEYEDPVQKDSSDKDPAQRDSADRDLADNTNQVQDGSGTKTGDSGQTETAGIVDTLTFEADSAGNADTLTFEADSFSVYAVVYTVDFHWEVNGKTYEFSIPGGGFVSFYDLVEALGIEAEDTDTEADEIQELVDGVNFIEFSDPELVSVSKAEEDTTVGAIKERLQLDCAYSAELTEQEIAEINSQGVKAGDWALIALKPFDTEESLAVSMKNGDTWTVKVTDAQEITDLGADTINVNKSHLICYEYNGQYYLLKNDGSADSSHTPATFENLNSTYCWTFNYVFEEKDLDETITYTYYLIRPIDNKTRTIALNAEGQDLVQRSNNNVAVVPAEGGGFKMIGYNNIRLDFDADGGSFFASEFPDNDPDDGITIHIWEMDSLPSYSYTAYSADEIRGSVQISGGTAKTENILDDEGHVIQTLHYYEAESSSDKMNAGEITAIPVEHRDGQGDNKWIFDHWTQDGTPLDKDEYPETIDVNTLPIPFNGSRLVAYFKKNPDYNVPPAEKEPSDFEDLKNWISELQSNPVPLDNDETIKTSEVYDYENRIYRVDIAAKSNFKTFNGNVDMAFCMDVSNSMYFPSALVPTVTSHYNNGSTSIPIYQINNSGWYNGRYWSNQGWLDTSRGYDNPYYLVADQANTATVFKIYYKDGEWRAIDASRTDDSDSTKWFRIGNNFTTNWAGYGTHPFNAGDNDNTTYTIYDAAPDDQGVIRNRFYYLNQGFTSATSDLTTIKNILAVAGNQSPNVRVAYNTFHKDLGNQRQDFQPVTAMSGISLQNSAGGGTRPDQAFINAQTFDWQGDDRYVILITDGAPQGQRTGENDNDFNRISQAVRDEAQILKDYGGVKFITIGLSMDKVPHGKQLLYDLADDDRNGEKMFFMAEDASDLPNILRQVVKTIMDDAVVVADVTDTVGEAFYAVDKNTGLPLEDGDMIDIDGCLTTDPEQAAGIVHVEDGITTVEWTDRAVDSKTGWHGTVFVKAKEEFLGGNAMETNAGAQIHATKYRMGENEYEFDETLINDKLKTLEVGFDSPRVNVNELSFPETDSEWTVYLGTEVDPKAQLKKLYENILVEKNVNEDGSLHYPLAPNNIADNRENQAVGDAATLRMDEVILECLKADEDLAELYVQDDELNWDAFLSAILSDNGLTVPYHLFGTEGEDSSITIRLARQIRDGEEDDLVGHSPHDTTVLNDGDTPAEKYTLTIRYDPDYDHVLPAGQGGKPGVNYNYNFATGTYGAMYQGHAAGRETGTIGHKINVYNIPLDVYKTDEEDKALAGAKFKLYKEDEENGAVIDGLDSSKKYIEVASATSGNDGVARLKQNGEDFGLVLGETYYLIEYEAPANYTKVDTVWAVQVQTEVGRFTDLDGKPIYSEIDPDPSAEPPVTAGTGVTEDMYPFNWDQGARIMLDGKDPVTVIVRGETEGTTSAITDGSFVSRGKAVSFRHTVPNVKGNIDITVNKTWEDEDHKPSSVQITLYRVSEKGHKWEDVKVVPSSCTAEGVKEYTCSECGKTETYVISAADHTPGTAHRENEEAPDCTHPGGYDTVVRCRACNAIISSEHTEIPATGHSWVSQETDTTDSDHYCYDTVDICSVCGEVNEESRVHHDHDWGEWQVTTPAQPGVAGEETRICIHNPAHIETRATDPLPNDHTVTIYFRCTGNGGGSQNYPGQITEIATRSGTGAGDMTIQWNWDQWTTPKSFDVSGLGTSTYTTSSSGNNTGARQTLTISNITSNLTIYITIRNGGHRGTDGSLIGQPTFAGTSNRSAPASTADAGKTAAKALRAAAKGPGDGTGESGDQLRDGEGQDSESGTETSMSHEQLVEYLNGLVSKAEATCEETDDAVHTYKEELDTYPITPDGQDNWTLSIEDLPRFNEYGNPYSYYVVETSSTDGYDVTYSGQDSGLQDGGATTINNKKLFGSLNITKTIRVAGGQAEHDGFPSGTYTYPVLITTVIGETTYYVQDANGTLATTPPETHLTVTGGAVDQEGPALTIEHLPYGVYTVTEIQPDSVEVSGYSFVVQEAGPQGEIHFQSTTSGDGTVGETEGSVSLENYYMKGASWAPEVDKWLNGTPHSGSAAGYSGYSFTLSEPAGQDTIPPQPGQPGNHTQTVVTDESGKAVFRKIDYRLHGNQQSRQYTYTITENRPAAAQNDPYIADDIQYDTSTIYVLVTVTKTGNGHNMVTEAHAAYYSDAAHTQPLAAVEFNNNEMASLSVEKTVSGDYTPTAGETFPITIKKGDLFLNSAGELVETDPQLTIKAGQTLNFPHVPVGTYVVTEGDAEREGYSLTTTYTYQAGGQEADTQSLTLGKGDSDSVSITNTYYQVNVTIIKIDEAARESATQTRLPQAKFKLYKYTIPEGGSTGTYTVFPNAANCEETTDSNGELQFTSLPNGKYRIDETEQPAGYVSYEKLEIYFTVENGTIKWTNAEGTEISSQDLVSYSPADKTFTVGNIAGAALPQSGGPGTTLLYLLGIMITALAGAGMLIKRMKKRAM